MVAVIQEDKEKKARFSRSKFLKSREWSFYQQALFDFGVSGSGHGIVNAVAGSGKSTSLVGLVASLPASAKIAVVAFNNHSVADLEAKMPSTVSVSTAHKYGMSALFRYFGEPFKPNDTKMRDLCRDAVVKLTERISKGDRLAFPEIDLFVGGFKSKDKVVASESRALRRSAASYLESIIHFAMTALSPLDVESLIAMEDHFTVEYEFSIELAHEALLPLVAGLIDDSVVKAIEKRDVSLDELIYLPVRLQLGFPAYDFVLNDEAQDSSNLMRTMIGQMASRGRLICVGDKFQSIQGFSGADADSFDRIIDDFNPTKLDLSICYRCPSSHLDLARRLVPGIHNKPDAIEGTISVVPLGKVSRLVSAGDLMLCRFTAPLISTCLDLIGRGIKARVRGRDIGSQITSLVESISGVFPDRFMDGIKSYCLPRIQKMKAAEQEDKAQKLEDRMAAAIGCFESFGFECKSKDEFCRQILNLFCDDNDRPPVTLATIHRSKGDEADRVWILGSDLLPFVKKARHQWQIQQELNLTYVALTRSKSALFLVPIGKNADAMIEDSLGGMDLPEPIETEITLVKSTPSIAPTLKPIKPAAKIQNDATPFPIPQRAVRPIEVGILVALYHNPALAARVLAIHDDMVTVQRGRQEPITVEIARVKALIPVAL